MTRLRRPHLDWPLALAVAGLVGIGLLTVYSATSIPGAHQGLWMKQLAWCALAFGAAWVVAAIHYRLYDSLAWPMYAIALVLLVAVLVVGTSKMGAKRWIEIGPLQFQPSELAKIATTFVLARFFDHARLDLNKVRWWLPPLFIALVPFVLVAKEPDLGTGLSFPVMLVAMYFWAGMPLGRLLLGLSPVFNVALFFVTGSIWWFVGLFVGLLAFARPKITMLVGILAINAAVAVALPQMWNHLHDYQKRRIETFLNPDHDPYGAGYQIIQSKIAIGSGGVTGKGYLKGSQKALSFLPMRHTDFIYSVVGEEGGFLGAAVVVLLYGVVVLRGYRLAAVARDGFAGLVAIGVVTALFFHIMVNMLMTVGWAPVTGVPLPFLSYGGTALIVNCVQIGLLQNVALRRREY
ncbi:MAG: rod shape-determining protein RodA [Candidatus Eisenbacteria bacterium]|uniref:Peptidoglycan glycosyltransferase RodA n=1 Tax=Eiseniibacteriota bacterium TaxID=2212470 RepID=A0A933W1U1_UNCEI|nr:rod shape-determining protein RodA [Candidatus Eisenbacteria bacterium]